MLTKVILEGVLGNKFGRVWNLFVNSPSEAIRLIDANRPGLVSWIKQNANVYARYRVVCSYENGQRESITEESYGMQRRARVIRFIPVPEGASGGKRNFFIGVGLIVAGAMSIFVNPYAHQLVYAGFAMVATGAAQMLTPTPAQKPDSQKNISSNYFNGVENTIQQGAPVPLVYGRVLVGSHLISATLTIDRIL